MLLLPLSRHRRVWGTCP